MNELLSFALWMYLIFLAFIGAISLLLISLAVRDWYKVKRHNIESENNTLKRLKLPIYYIKHDGLTIDDAITLNIRTKNWGYRDYLEHWITKGREEYKYFDRFLEKYGFGYSVSLALLGLERASDGTRLTDIFNEGKFIPKYKEFAEKIGDRCLEMGEYGSFTTNRTFVLAFDQACQMDGWDYQVFTKKLAMCPDRFTKCSNQENYLRMMEDVINYHNHGERIRLY